MFRNILVAIDGSSHADRALSEAIDLARCSNGRMTIMTAVSRPAAWANTPAAAAAYLPLALELEDEAREALHKAVDHVPASVPVTKILTHEPIRHALSERLQTGGHDLLVMGSRGRGAITASLLGSVSHYALHHSPVPVLIVHADIAHAESVHAEPEHMASAPARRRSRAASEPLRTGRDARVSAASVFPYGAPQAF
jgi:nucleotide-binding universal stress UspA family protein